MREIVFRGKRIDDGEWVEGYITEHTMIPADMQSYIGWIIASKPTGLYEYDLYEVDPDTVGQYTGLKDKNGKRIFEGDILKDYWGKVYEVIFTTKQCGFMVDCKIAPSEHETGRYRIGEAWCDTIQVIGNIHDNPELLEVR